MTITGDLSDRLLNRVQISSDALAAYVGAIELVSGAMLNDGQIVKFYEAEQSEQADTVGPSLFIGRCNAPLRWQQGFRVIFWNWAN